MAISFYQGRLIFDTGNRDQGTGIREQGTGTREQGTGNRNQGTGNREQGIVATWITISPHLKL
ncbi:MAG: hypothetical protein WCF54_21280 [Terracidiphilus sp.]